MLPTSAARQSVRARVARGGAAAWCALTEQNDLSEGAALGSSTIIALSPETLEVLAPTDDELSVYSSALATGGRGVGWSLEPRKTEQPELRPSQTADAILPHAARACEAAGMVSYRELAS